MDVGSTSVIVTGEKRVKRRNSVVVGWLDTAHGSELQDARVLGVSHARVALDTGVDALFWKCQPLP